MKPSVNILVVIGEMRHGGAQRVVSRLSQEWARQRQNHKVTVAVFDADDPAYAVGGTLHDLKTPATRNPILRLWRPIQRVWRLSRLMGRGRFTHIISFMEDSNFPVIVAGWVSGMLGRVTVSTRVDPRYLAWFQRVLLRVLYHLPQRVVTLSQGVKDILEAWGVPAKRLVFIPTPAPLGQINSPPPPRNLLRPTRGRDYILAVGRLHRQKGFDLLLRAYAGLEASLGEAKFDLVILGEGEERQNLVSLAHAIGIDGRVHLIGEVPHPENWYAHAECFVLSSRYEGWGNVIVEAMAYGCPVVSFDCPVGPSEIIAPKNGRDENGVLVRNGDVKALAKAIAKVLDDGKLRQRLITAGKKRAGDFAVGEIARLWLVP
ncbi:MAG: glycosyltransferase [Proteobacteria bacterium]|nr:glycosyltransferase [Pseudomonadota bacterium]